MARKNVKIETPGQETSQDDDSDLIGGDAGAGIPGPANTPEQLNDATAGATVITVGDDKSAIVQQRVAKLLDGAALEERNAILSGLNERGAAVIARFEALEFLDADDRRLTDNLEFLTLVKKATDVATGGAGPMVTNEEGKKQPAPGKPVLTEHGWHVPG
ncbi:hypothetical protein ACQUWL_28970 [Serratia marcescens]|uniref:hypothetical protein n=1 Tax=Serratia marcescens TaxID=615 RepID=UPI003D170830